MTGRPGRMLLLAAVLCLVAAGCGGGVRSLSFATPPATTVPLPAPPDSLPAGLSAIAEAPVPGVTTTVPPAIGPGAASINGTVTGPSGPVAGATVQIDRFVGLTFASARTTTAADGTWSFRNILGGDYRVRAWLAPALDMQTPQTLFLASGQPQSLALKLTSYAGNQVEVAINPAAPVVDQPANLVIQVTNPSVDANGILHSPPVAGAVVTLVNGSGWLVQNGNPLQTDTSGQAAFMVECTAVGADPLGAQVSTDPAVSLQMPPCDAPPPTTTTNPSLPTSTTCPTTPSNPGDTTTTLTFGQC